jgi:hypothetical protein
MASNGFLQLSGVALASGGLLATAGWVLFALFDPEHQSYQSRAWLPLNGLIIAGGVGMAMGLPGLYAIQAEASGLLGLAGFLVFFVGITIPYFAVHSIETATMPDVPASLMRWVAIGALSLLSGALLSGIATWRAGIFPAWIGAGLVVSALLGPLTLAPFLPARASAQSPVVPVYDADSSRGDADASNAIGKQCPPGGRRQPQRPATPPAAAF